MYLASISHLRVKGQDVPTCQQADKNHGRYVDAVVAHRVEVSRLGCVVRTVIGLHRRTGVDVGGKHPWRLQVSVTDETAPVVQDAGNAEVVRGLDIVHLGSLGWPNIC